MPTLNMEIFRQTLLNSQQIPIPNSQLFLPRLRPEQLSLCSLNLSSVSFSFHSSFCPQVQLVGQSLYLLNFSAQKLRSVRLGSEPFEPLPSPTSALINRQKPIVIVGGGIAGVTCAQTLRQLSYTGPIVLISRENELPYDRKSLSKVIL
jgi:hypothetical protein